MSALLVLLALVGNDVQGPGLPLQSPLSWWLGVLEAVSPSLLPATLPASEGWDTGGTDLPRALSGPAGLLARWSLPPGTAPGDTVPGGFGARFSGTVAGQVLLPDEGEAVTRAGPTLRGHAFLLPGLTIDEQLSVWAGSDEMPPDHFSPYHEGREEGRHLYVDWGYLAWEAGPLGLGLGRVPQQWGPGRFTQLMLSDNSPPLDMIRLSLDLGRHVDFTGLTATVDSDSSIYLVAHRLDVRPLDWMRLGVSEAILYRAEGLDFAYMNPLIPWYPVQWNERLDDNAFIGLDATVRPFRGLVAYGELLVDDIQYQTEWDRPNKLGWTAGLSAVAPGGEAAVTAEYTRIDRYVYSQRRPCNYYLHHGDIIGSGLGPDADRIRAEAGTALAWPLTVRAGADYTRHGEGTVTEGWPDSVTAGGVVFPSGVVERTTGGDLTASWYPTGWLDVHASVRADRVENVSHVQDSTESGLKSSLELFLRW